MTTINDNSVCTRPVPFLQRIEQANKLWAVVIPEVPTPPDSTWVRWLASFLDTDVERAIVLVPNKFRDNWPLNNETVYKFVTSTAAAYRRQRRGF